MKRYAWLIIWFSIIALVYAGVNNPMLNAETFGGLAIGKFFRKDTNNTADAGTDNTFDDLNASNVVVYTKMGIATNVPNRPLHIRASATDYCMQFSENSGPDKWEWRLTSDGILVISDSQSDDIFWLDHTTNTANVGYGLNIGGTATAAEFSGGGTALTGLNQANITNTLTPIQFVIQDPTNGIGYAMCNPINDGSTVTIDSIRAMTKHGSITGVMHVGIQDWNQTATNSAFVDAVDFNSTGVNDSSIAGSTTLSNKQEIVVYLSAVSAFATTNQVNGTIFVRH